jgi:hypothetical protein
MHPVSELDTAAVDRRAFPQLDMIIACGEHVTRFSPAMSMTMPPLV